MLTCIKTQFKGSSKENEQQVKQHEAPTLNTLRNVNARLKKSVDFFYSILLLSR